MKTPSCCCSSTRATATHRAATEHKLRGTLELTPKLWISFCCNLNTDTKCRDREEKGKQRAGCAAAREKEGAKSVDSCACARAREEAGDAGRKTARLVLPELPKKRSRSGQTPTRIFGQKERAGVGDKGGDTLINYNYFWLKYIKPYFKTHMVSKPLKCIREKEWMSGWQKFESFNKNKTPLLMCS